MLNYFKKKSAFEKLRFKSEVSKTSTFLFFPSMWRPDFHLGLTAYSECSNTTRLITAGGISQADSVETLCGLCVFVCDGGASPRGVLTLRVQSGRVPPATAHPFILGVTDDWLVTSAT